MRTPRSSSRYGWGNFFCWLWQFSWYASRACLWLHALYNFSFMQMMWVGVLHHVCNEHSWTTSRCEHEPLNEDSPNKPWMIQGNFNQYFCRIQHCMWMHMFHWPCYDFRFSCSQGSYCCCPWEKMADPGEKIPKLQVNICKTCLCSPKFFLNFQYSSLKCLSCFKCSIVELISI